VLGLGGIGTQWGLPVDAQGTEAVISAWAGATGRGGLQEVGTGEALLGFGGGGSSRVGSYVLDGSGL